MASYYNNNNRGYGYNGGGGPRTQTPPQPPKEIKPLPIPEHYVDEAEKLMEQQLRNITTSKLRNFLSLAADIFNAEQIRNDPKLLPESIAAVQFMRIRVAYECGRDEKTKQFVEAVKLLEYIKGIGDQREELVRFYHYMEALVAYHRYYGGREN